MCFRWVDQWGKALQLDTNITNSLERVLQNTGFLEVVEQMGVAYNKVVERLDDISAELQKSREENKLLREALPNPQQQQEQQRHERFNERMTELRIERGLRKAAETEWAKDPVMKKAGWFGKEEDQAAKENFIRDYIDKRFEKEMKKEWFSKIEGGVNHGTIE